MGELCVACMRCLIVIKRLQYCRVRDYQGDYYDYYSCCYYYYSNNSSRADYYWRL